jgi:aspartate carbamoyltransferase catalytic subunit
MRELATRVAREKAAKKIEPPRRAETFEAWNEQEPNVAEAADETVTAHPSPRHTLSTKDVFVAAKGVSLPMKTALLV